MNGPFKIGEIRPIQYFLIVGVIIALLFSMIADGDESVSAIIPQIVQWQFQVLVPIFLLIAIHTSLHKIPWFDKLNPWLKLILSGCIGAAVFSPLALWIDSVYGDAIKIKLGSALLHEFISVAPPVIVCWIAINAPWLLGFQLTRTEKSFANKNAVSSENLLRTEHVPSFYELLPENIRAELVYLKAELHYLKVVTIKGSALILFNLKDAISQLEQEGIKTHRSFWVSLKFIKEIKKSGRQGHLITSTDEEIPISRNKFANVKNFFSD